MRVSKYGVFLDRDTQSPYLVKETDYECDQELHSSDAVRTWLNETSHLNEMAEEQVYMICFNARLQPLAIFCVSHGETNRSFLRPREVFLRAVLCSGAVSIVIAHNHPSFDCTPSGDDIRVCERMHEVGELIGIYLLDFLIVGGDAYCSFRDEKIFEF